MTTLIDFLEARLAEDEAAARDMPSGNIVEYLALDLKCYSGERTPGDTTEGANILWASIHVGDFAQRWPLLDDFRDRVLREVQAKRAIIKAHSPTWTTVEWNDDQDGTGHANVCNACGNHDISDWKDWSPELGEAWMPEGMNPPYTVWPCDTLKLLAAPYSDHPDYRKEWAA